MDYPPLSYSFSLSSCVSRLNKQLTSYGVDTTLVDLGKHVMADEELPLPPAILGKLGNDPAKKTILIYGHFDVQPVRFILSSLVHVSKLYRHTYPMAGTLIHSNYLLARTASFSAEVQLTTRVPFLDGSMSFNTTTRTRRSCLSTSNSVLRAWR